jgi:adenylate cyclase
MLFMIGRTLAHYHITAAIGAGGMGEVFRATDTRLGRAVALKVLPSDMARDAERLARFQREARVIAALNHPHIVTIYAVDEVDGIHFLTMELIEGQSLAQLIPAPGLAVDRTLAIGMELADALAAAHDKGIVHRDLKPANVMVTADGRVKVLDFGLAKELRPTEPADASLTVGGRTEIGVVMGTPAYMSPEQVAGRPMDHRTDIFSLGILLYQMASGQRPFEGGTSMELASAILRDVPRPLTEIRSDVPADLGRLIRRCLEKDVQRRVQTARDVGNELRDIAGSAARGPYPASTRVTAGASASDAGDARAADGFWIAVLPFKYSGGNPDVGALVEGLAEEIVTGLSRFSYLRVLARAADQKVTARYVMDGSVRQAGLHLRLTVQLVDAATGAHLWAETYDRPFQPHQIFALQDELVPRIVSTVADQHGVLVHSMSAVIGKKSDAQLSPHEAALRVFGFHERMSAEEHAHVRALLERAVEQAPDDSDCWAMLATVYTDEHMFGFNVRPDPLGRAQAAARRAVELSPSSALASQALAQSLFFRKELQACRPVAERTIALNPMDGAIRAFMGILLALCGDWELGCAAADQAMKLNPHFPGWYWLAPIFHAHYQGDYRGAASLAMRINIPGYFWVPLTVAAALGQLGDLAAAQKALGELVAIRPDFGSTARAELEKWFQPDLVESYLEGLRHAGLFERDQRQSDSGTARTASGFWIDVRPFKYAGTDAGVAALADGLSEEIVIGLSRFSYLKVVARGAAHQQVAARYVLDGTLRQAGSQLRLAVQLVDTTTSAHLWAETYNSAFDPHDLFAVQDDLVPRVVSTVADAYGVLPHSMSQAVRGRPAGQLSPYEALLRSFSYAERVTAEEHAEAKDGLARAVEQSPRDSDCWAMLSIMLADEYGHGFGAQRDTLERAVEAARRAVDANPANHRAYQALAWSLFLRKDIQASRHAGERALSLNPLDGCTAAYIGQTLAFSGDWDRGLDLIARARRLNPNHPGWYWYAPFLDAYRKGNDSAALSLALKMNLPGVALVEVALAATYGRLGDSDAARRPVRALLALKPDYGAIARVELLKWFDGDTTTQLMEGLSQAGLDVAPPTAGSMPIGSVTDTALRAMPAASIAVLPFANLSADKDQEYFSDGLAEEIINLLAQVSGLKVIARTSAFAFRGKDQDIREIARALGVATVLQGSVRRAGSRIRVSTQLINASDGAHLWSERFDRELTEVFAVQDEIAAAIASALKVTLTGQSVSARSHDPNLAAYDAFLRGKHHYYRFSPAHFTSAEQDFTQAIQLDPQWAEPHAALGDLYFAMGFYGWRPLDDMIRRARDEARKALEYSPTHPLGHAVLGVIAAHHDYNWQEAADQFRRVGSAEFVHPNVHLLSLFYLLSLGRFDAALDEVAKAIAQDPQNSFWRSRRSWVLANANRYDESLAEASKALELDPTNYQARMMMALCHACQNNLTRALEAAEAVHRTAAFDAFGTGILGGVLSRLGEKDRAQQVVASMTGAVTIGMTIYHLVAGEIDAALDWYQKDIEAHRPNAPMVAFAAWLEPLRASPRWAHVAGMMNLDAASS